MTDTRGNFAADLARALDPTIMMRDAGLEPQPWQAKALRNWHRDHLLNCSRQVGKSTVAAFLATHNAMFNDGALVLLVSRAERQSAELFRKVKVIIDTLDYAPGLITDKELSLEFTNRSRIVALPGNPDSIRGLSGCTCLIVDEAARVDAETLAAVEPMLATTGGPMWSLSTPAGKRGWWYDRWTGQADAERVKIPWDKSGILHADYVKKQKAAMPDWQFAQEYECEFSDADEQIFSTELITNAINPEIGAIWL